MQQTKSKVSILLASILTVSLLAAAPVGAERGQPIVAGPVTEASDATDGSGTTGNTSDSSNGHGNSLRVQAAQLLQAQRQNGKEHSQAQKQQACDQRQKSITTRTGNYGTAAQRHLDVFNSIFTKVQAFHDSKQLNVPNYDTLVATAKDKQTAAQSAVDALKALDVQIDCTQPDPASTVATIKSAVSDARTALQDYRSAIKDVIVALKGASTANTQSSTSDTTTTTGGNQ